MKWDDARKQHPDEWLVVEALHAHSDGQRRVLDDLAVVEVCPDGAAAFLRYRALHAERPDRELYFVHTANQDLSIDERPWIGVRWTDAPGMDFLRAAGAIVNLRDLTLDCA